VAIERLKHDNSILAGVDFYCSRIRLETKATNLRVVNAIEKEFELFLLFHAGLILDGSGRGLQIRGGLATERFDSS